MVFHHTGYLVSSIEEAMEGFFVLGFHPVGDIMIDEYRKVRILFLIQEKQMQVELIEPLNEDSSVYELLQRQGAGAYHFCFSVRKEEQAEIQQFLKRFRFLPLGEAVPAPACGGKEVAFFYSKRIGLIELLYE